MKKEVFIRITILFVLIPLFLTVSCRNNNTAFQNTQIQSGPKLERIEISGFPNETEIISSATDDILVNNKNFKINYAIKVLGNGKNSYSDDLELKVVLETSLLEEKAKIFTEVIASKSVDMLSIKFNQPGLGQYLSVSICPSAVVNRNKNTGSPDIYIVYYLLKKGEIFWETNPRSDGYLYGTLTFLMESKDSSISSGEEKTKIDKYFKNASFYVLVRKK